jgi:hypothetical protein
VSTGLVELAPTTAARARARARGSSAPVCRRCEHGLGGARPRPSCAGASMSAGELHPRAPPLPCVGASAWELRPSHRCHERGLDGACSILVPPPRAQARPWGTSPSAGSSSWRARLGFVASPGTTTRRHIAVPWWVREREGIAILSHGSREHGPRLAPEKRNPGA